MNVKKHETKYDKLKAKPVTQTMIKCYIKRMREDKLTQKVYEVTKKG